MSKTNKQTILLTLLPSSFPYFLLTLLGMWEAIITDNFQFETLYWCTPLSFLSKNRIQLHNDDYNCINFCYRQITKIVGVTYLKMVNTTKYNLYNPSNFHNPIHLSSHHSLCLYPFHFSYRLEHNRLCRLL